MKTAEPTLRQYLLKRIVKRKGPLKSYCWIWKSAEGAKRSPWVDYAGKQDYASRFSYREFKGPIPEGKIVRHKCDVHACINPDHLLLGTKKDNRLDFMERHPRARELMLEAAIRAGKGTKRFWDSMTPRQRKLFINRRHKRQLELGAMPWQK